MVSFPNCKINLGLTILRRRADGYHDLDTVFYPLPLKDALEIVPASQLQFSAYGAPIPGDPASNLCYKAYHLLQEDHPGLQPVHIHLYKRIPMGAGLGGGSSDAAAALSLLDRLFQLNLGQDRLMDYAARLGSDCPFFILNRPALGGGRGEQLQVIDLDLSRYSFVLVHPGIHISTPWAFSQCKPGTGGRPVGEIIGQAPETWKEELINAFEAPVLSQYPALAAIKQQLYDKGAIYASMTGSGSSFFGIFTKGSRPSFTFTGDPEVTYLT